MDNLPIVKSIVTHNILREGGILEILPSFPKVTLLSTQNIFASPAVAPDHAVCSQHTSGAGTDRIVSTDNQIPTKVKVKLKCSHPNKANLKSRWEKHF